VVGAARLVGAGVLLLGVAACSPQEQTTRYKPFFTGIAEAEFNDQPVNADLGHVDPALRNGIVAENAILEKPDGSKVYLTYAPMQLFIHVQNLLDEGTPEADRIILDQLTDEKTKEHMRSQGKDPIGFVEDLHLYRKEIARTFARMPMGEHTPTVVVEQPGDRQWVLVLTGQARDGLKFKEVWIRQDMGQWKLEWLK
jgi:hypothetical protein